MKSEERPARSRETYIAWVVYQVFGVDPADRLDQWAREWEQLLEAIGPVSPIASVSSVIAKWEFLGSLYRGTTGSSGEADARSYVHDFLVPIRADYAGLFHLSGSGSTQSGFDFYKMLRNKPLHGHVPAGVSTKDFEGVVTWWVGQWGIEPDNHLKVDANGGLHVNTQLLSGELLDSIKGYQNHLRADKNRVVGGPNELWQRSHWARYGPIGVNPEKWMKLGDREISMKRMESLIGRAL